MFNKYPYTDFHELNLDWILKMIKEMRSELTEFEALNEITFDGVWDITKQYPAWTIVTYGPQGYISLKPVPAGINIINTDYWMKVMDYSAILADIENRLSILEAEVSAMTTRRIIFVADSYATYYTTLETKNYIELAAERAGFVKNDTYYDFHLSGAGFSRPGNQAFIEVLRSHESDVLNPETISDIIVCGSANDQTAANEAAITNEIDYFMRYCKQTYPNAHVSIGSFSKSLEESYVNAIDMVLRAYTSCATYDAEYICNSECVMQEYQLFRADHLHPLEVGIYELAKYLGMYLTGNKIEVIRDLNYQNHVLFKFRADGYFADRASNTTILLKQRNGAHKMAAAGHSIFMPVVTNEALTISVTGRQHNNFVYLLDATFHGLGSNQINTEAYLQYNDGSADRIIKCILTMGTTLTSDGIPIDVTMLNDTGSAISIPGGTDMVFLLPNGWNEIQ